MFCIQRQSRDLAQGVSRGWLQSSFMTDPVAGWSYFTLVAKNPELAELDDKLNLLGADGWELAAGLSTVKTWINLSGNDLVLLFKKPGAGHRPDPQLLTAFEHGGQAW